MQFAVCPNCGSELPLQDGYCTCCTWSEGEPYFKPYWMTEKVWQKGRLTNWLPLKKKGKQRAQSKQASVILESIRKRET